MGGGGAPRGNTPVGWSRPAPPCTLARLGHGHELRCICVKGHGLCGLVKTGLKRLPTSVPWCPGPLRPSPRPRPTPSGRIGSSAGGVGGPGPVTVRRLVHPAARPGRAPGCSELRLVPRLRVAGGQLVAAAALPALGAAGHVGPGVGADEIPAGRREDPEAASARGRGRADGGVDMRWVGTWYLHDVVGLQPRVGWGVDEHVGEGVLVVIHLVCGGDRARQVVTARPLPTSAHLRPAGPGRAAGCGPAAEPPGLSSRAALRREGRPGRSPEPHSLQRARLSRQHLTVWSP